MPRDFYPFVEEDDKPGNAKSGKNAQEGVVYPARIAVYDDPAVTPRVVVIEPCDVRDFLAKITEEVTKLAREQGGTIPFTIIRELVENFIHAAFIEPTITILDGGNTIRFCDQGPGIREKDQALQFGTTSATDEMKHYIRGVGSGLPIAQQYMIDKGGSLTIQDNINGGTIVTISTRPEGECDAQLSPHTEGEGMGSDIAGAQAMAMGADPTMMGMPGQAPMAAQAMPTQGGYAQPWQQAAGQPWQAHQAWTSQMPTTQQQAWQGQQGGMWPQQQMWGQTMVQPAAQPMQQPQQAAAGIPAGIPMGMQPQYQQAGMAAAQPSISQRATMILTYLASHETVGGVDLEKTYGGSQPTWSRELKVLDEMGLTRKDGQKRRLTAMGSAYLTNMGS